MLVNVAPLILAASLSLPPPPPDSGPLPSAETMRVTSLSRFAVKGLGPSALTSVHVPSRGETFPDDRRFALLRRVKAGTFDASDPEWVHKENFLCAFTAPELMAKYECEYRIVSGEEADPDGGTASAPYGLPWDDVSDRAGNDGETRRMLTVWERDGGGRSGRESASPILGPVDLATESGRDRTGRFFSSVSGEDVVCVTAAAAGGGEAAAGKSASAPRQHTHQFGNTRSGVKARGDTRTVHLVNAATVRQFSDAIGTPLNPSRFRPNIVVDGLEPWGEFDLVGKTLAVVGGGDDGGDGDVAGGGGMLLDVVSTTVRCAGVGIDPDDPSAGMLDVPALLVEHFPERGPYFGVYAVVRRGGRLALGDTMTLIGETDEIAQNS